MNFELGIFFRSSQLRGFVQGLRRDAPAAGRALDDVTRSATRSGRAVDAYGASTRRASSATQGAMRSFSRSSRVVGDHSRQIDTLTRRTDNLAASQKRLSSGLGGVVRQLVATAAAVVSLHAGIAQISGSIDVFREFELRMAGVQAVSQATAGEMATLESQTRSLGETTIFTARQAAEAQEALARAGFTVTENLAALPRVLQLAAAGELSLAQAADIAAGTLRGFQLQATNAQRPVDVLAKSAAIANTNVQEMGEGLKFAAPTAQGLGISLEDTAAAMAVLADNLLKGTLGGTGFRQAMLGIIDPSGKAETVLDDLGISADKFRAVLQEKGLIDALKLLVSESTDIADAISLAGARGGSALQILISNLDLLSEKRSALGDVRGEAERMANVKLDTLSGDTAELNSAVESLRITFGEALSPALREAQDRLTEFFQSGHDSATTFGETMGKVIGAAVTLFITLAENASALLLVFGAFAASKILIFLGALGVSLVSRIKEWGTYTAGVTAATAAQQANAIAAGKLIPIYGAQGQIVSTVAASTTAATASTWSFSAAIRGMGAAIAANPIGLIVTALTLLIVTFGSMVGAVGEAEAATQAYHEELRFGSPAIEQATRAHAKLADTIRDETQARKDNQQTIKEGKRDLEALVPVLDQMEEALDAGDVEGFNKAAMAARELGVAVSTIGDESALSTVKREVEALRAEMGAAELDIISSNQRIAESERGLQAEVGRFIEAENDLRREQRAELLRLEAQVARTRTELRSLIEGGGDRHSGFDTAFARLGAQLGELEEKARRAREELEGTADRLDRLADIAGERLTELFQSGDIDAAATLINQLPDDVFENLFPDETREGVIAFQRAITEAGQAFVDSMAKAEEAAARLNKKVDEQLTKLKALEASLQTEAKALNQLAAAALKGEESFTEAQRALEVEKRFQAEAAKLTELHADKLKGLRAAIVQVVDAEKRLAGARTIGDLERQIDGLDDLLAAYSESEAAAATMSEALELEADRRSNAANALESQRDEIESLTRTLRNLETASEAAEDIKGLERQIDGLERLRDAYQESAAAGDAMVRQIQLEEEIHDRIQPLLAANAVSTQELAEKRTALALIQSGLIAGSEEMASALQEEITALLREIGANEELIETLEHRLRLKSELESGNEIEGQLAGMRAEVEVLRRAKEALDEMSLSQRLLMGATEAANIELEVQRRIMELGADATAEQVKEIRALVVAEAQLRGDIEVTGTTSVNFDSSALFVGLAQLASIFKEGGKEAEGFASKTEAVIFGISNVISGFAALGSELGIFTQQQIRNARALGQAGASIGGAFGGEKGAAIGGAVGTAAGLAGMELGRTGNAVLSGASAGAAFGPWGAVIGAFVGLALDAMHTTAQTFVDGSTAGGQLHAELLNATTELAKQTNEIVSAITDTVNRILDAIDGTFSEFTTFAVQIREDSEGIRVWVDGQRRSFGEDVQGAIDYAVSEIFKRTEVLGTSKVVTAALERFIGSSVAELESAVQDALTIDNLGLPELGVQLKREMMELDRLLMVALNDFGAGAENVLHGPGGLVATLEGAYNSAFGISEDVGEATRRNIAAVQAQVAVQKAQLITLGAELEGRKAALQASEATTRAELDQRSALISGAIANINAMDLEGRQIASLATVHVAAGQTYALTASAAAEALGQIEEALTALDALDFSSEAIESAVARARQAASRGAAGADRSGVLARLAELQEAAGGIASVTSQLLRDLGSFASLLEDAQRLKIGEEALAEVRATGLQVIEDAVRQQLAEVAATGDPLALERTLELLNTLDLSGLPEGVREAFKEILQGIIEDAKGVASALSGLVAGPAFSVDIDASEIQPFLDMAGGVSAAAAQIRELNQTFAEFVAELALAGAGEEDLAAARAAHVAAIHGVRDALLESVQGYTDAVLGISDVDRQLLDLAETFGEAHSGLVAAEEALAQVNESYDALGAAGGAAADETAAGFASEMGLLAAAYREALMQVRDGILDSVQEFTDAAQGIGEFERRLIDLQETFLGARDGLASVDEALADADTFPAENGEEGGPQALVTAIGEVFATLPERVKPPIDETLLIFDEAMGTLAEKVRVNLGGAGLVATDPAEGGAVAAQMPIDRLPILLADIGTAAGEAKPPLEAVETSLDRVSDSSSQLGKDLALLDAAQQRAIKSLGVDFIRSLDQLGISLPTELVLELAEAEFILAQAEALSSALALAAAGAFDDLSISLDQLLGIIAGATFDPTSVLPPPGGGGGGGGSGTDQLDALRQRVLEQIEAWNRLPLGDVTNQAITLMETLVQLRADAEAAGIAVEEVNAAFEVALRTFVDDALAPFEDLNLSPLERELNSITDRFVDLIVAFETAGASAEDMARLQEAFNTAMEDFLDRATAGIQSFLEELRGSDPRVSSQEAFETSQAEFRDLLARAQGGDLEALAELEGAARAFRDNAQQFLGGGVGFQEVLDEIIGGLESVDDIEIVPADIALLQEQADALLDLIEIGEAQPTVGTQDGGFGGVTRGLTTNLDAINSNTSMLQTILDQLANGTLSVDDIPQVLEVLNALANDVDFLPDHVGEIITALSGVLEVTDVLTQEQIGNVLGTLGGVLTVVDDLTGDQLVTVATVLTDILGQEDITAEQVTEAVNLLLQIAGLEQVTADNVGGVLGAIAGVLTVSDQLTQDQVGSVLMALGNVLTVADELAPEQLSSLLASFEVLSGLETLTDEQRTTISTMLTSMLSLETLTDDQRMTIESMLTELGINTGVQSAAVDILSILQGTAAGTLTSIDSVLGFVSGTLAVTDNLTQGQIVSMIDTLGGVLTTSDTLSMEQLNTMSNLLTTMLGIEGLSDDQRATLQAMLNTVNGTLDVDNPSFNNLDGLPLLPGQITAPLTAQLEGMEGGISATLEGVEGGLTATLTSVEGQLVATLVDNEGNIVATLTGVEAGISSTLGTVENALAQTLNDVEGGLTTTLVGVEGGLTSTLVGVEGGLTTTLTGVETGVTGQLVSLEGGVSNTLDSLGSGIGTQLGTLESGVDNQLGFLSNAISAFENSMDGVLTQTANQLQSLISSAGNTQNAVGNVLQDTAAVDNRTNQILQDTAAADNRTASILQDTASMDSRTASILQDTAPLGSLSGTINNVSGTVASVSSTLASVNFNLNNSFDDVLDAIASIPQAATGAFVKDDGLVFVHANERILTPAQTRAFDALGGVKGLSALQGALDERLGAEASVEASGPSVEPVGPVAVDFKPSPSSKPVLKPHGKPANQKPRPKPPVIYLPPPMPPGPPLPPPKPPIVISPPIKPPDPPKPRPKPRPRPRPRPRVEFETDENGRMLIDGQPVEMPDAVAHGAPLPKPQPDGGGSGKPKDDAVTDGLGDVVDAVDRGTKADRDQRVEEMKLRAAQLSATTGVAGAVETVKDEVEALRRDMQLERNRTTVGRAE